MRIIGKSITKRRGTTGSPLAGGGGGGGYTNPNIGGFGFDASAVGNAKFGILVNNGWNPAAGESAARCSIVDDAGGDYFKRDWSPTGVESWIGNDCLIPGGAVANLYVRFDCYFDGGSVPVISGSNVKFFRTYNGGLNQTALYWDNGALGFHFEAHGGSAVQCGVGFSSSAIGGTWASEGMTTYDASAHGKWLRFLVHFAENEFALPRARMWYLNKTAGATTYTPIVQRAGAAVTCDNYVWGKANSNADWVNGDPGEPSWLEYFQRGGSTNLAGLRVVDEQSATLTAPLPGGVFIRNGWLSTLPISPTYGD
jgi:hypothetical protein